MTWMNLADTEADLVDTGGIGGTLAGNALSLAATRAEYRFASPPPRTSSESAAAGDRELEDYLHVYLANRGILITPFHNMALMSPATTDADVDRHTEVFTAALADVRS